MEAVSSKGMRKKKTDFIFAGIFILFFGILFLTGAPIYVGDTFQHENQMIMREPGYALLIQGLRFLAPQMHYWILIALQNLLAIVGNTIIIIFMRKRFSLGILESLLFTAILLIPHLLIPFFSSTHLVLTNALMTEGILFSLYPLAFISLLDMIWSKKPIGRESFRTIGLFFLLSLIRGQMMVLFIVWFFVVYIQSVKNAVWETNRAGKKRDTFALAENIARQGLIAAVAILIIAFSARSVLIRGYNFLEQGLFVDTVSGKAMSFANVLYVADREDGEAITDDALRALFYEIYDSADADRMNYKYAPSGLINRAAHHEQCHDELNFTYFAEPTKQFLQQTQGLSVERYQELMAAVDQVAEKLSAALMSQVIFRYLRTYISVITLGFVRTVSYEYPLLIWYAAFIYFVAIVLTAKLFKSDTKSQAAPFMAVVLLTIVGNVCATALMIQCTSRYMIYNLPLFYMAGFLELRELVGIRRK